MGRYEFLRPRLVGARFQGAAIPLEVLRDLAILDDMMVEVAKWRFKQEHANRQRVPRGFADGVRLTLVGIDEGSAIANLVLEAPEQAEDDGRLRWFKEARSAVIQVIAKAEAGNDVLDDFPESALAYFDKLGRSLRSDEVLELATPNGEQRAHLNVQTRRRLLLASPAMREFTEERVLYGVVSEGDADRGSFEMKLANGIKLKGPMPRQHEDSILEALRRHRERPAVKVGVIVRIDRNGNLLRIEEVDHFQVLGPLDVGARLAELVAMPPGGGGDGAIRLDPDRLAAFEERFNANFPDTLPNPRIFPTPNGGLQLEWDTDTCDASVELDLQTGEALWHSLDLETGQDEERRLNLSDEGDWRQLAELLGRHLAGDE